MRKTRRMYVLSNMYPSEQNVRYGIFVKRFVENFENEFRIELVAMPKRYSSLSKLTGYLGLYARVFQALLKSKKKDLVYVHFPLYFSYLLIPFVLCKRTLVLNFHGNDALFDTTLKKILAPGLKWVASKADLIVVPSAYYRKLIMELMRVPRRKVCIYPSGGIDLSVFRPLPNEGKSFIFGFVSNFIHEKGWKVFLDALVILQGMGLVRDYGAIMVGDGPDKEEILTEIGKKKLPVRVVDSVPQSELAKLYAEFDVFVFPTFRKAESLGLVGLEAMACGVPVLASMVGGPMGYVDPGHNGFLFERKDSRSLAHLMQKMLGMSALELTVMRKNCIQTAQQYENAKVKKDLLKSLKSI